MRYILLLIVSLSVVLLSGNPAPCAGPPDAGQILQEQKRLVPQFPETLPETDMSRDAEESQPESETRVLVKGVRFSGNDGIVPDAELQEIVSDAIGREHSLADLQRLSRQVAAYLRDEKNLLVRVYLPRQEIADGIVEIALIAGRLEASPTVNIAQPHRIKGRVLGGIADAFTVPGEVLRVDKLQQAVLLINDLPGVAARAVMERGSAPGTVRISFDAQEGPLFSGQATGDTFGNRYTGVLRGSSQLFLNDPSGLGDQLRFSVIGSEGLFNGVAAYALPLGARGLRGGISYSGMYYKLGKELSALDADGRADVLTATLSYPHVRSRSFSLWQGFSYEFRSLEDRVSGVAVRDRELHALTFDLSVSAYDRFGGGGLTSAWFGYAVGELELGLAADAANDAAGPETGGHYSKFNYSLSRLQRLPSDFTLFTAVNGQFASKNLDSSEKFILGGPTGLRAYPSGEAAGDEGHSMTFELRHDLPVKPFRSAVQLVTFFDAGYIRLHKKSWPNAITTATGKNDYWLYGAGAGVNVTTANNNALRVSFAHTVGDNPGRSLDGNNADNKDSNVQFWLQGVVRF